MLDFKYLTHKNIIVLINLFSYNPDQIYLMNLTDFTKESVRHSLISLMEVGISDCQFSLNIHESDFSDF